MKDEWPGRWQHRTVVCLASGPSLTPEDCETVRLSGHPVVVTNTTFKMAPWADVVLAMDCKWWIRYHEEVKATCSGARMGHSQLATKYGVETTWGKPWFSSFANTGCNAISLAIVTGAAKVLLLGYDCQRTGGKTHWHGDHVAGLSNARSIDAWPAKFRQVAKHATKSGVAVINCTRETALTCFPRGTLIEQL